MDLDVLSAVQRPLRRRHADLARPGRIARRWGLRRFSVPTALRDTDLGGTFELPFERIGTMLGFDYGATGWHPYVATLAARRERPDLTYATSPLGALHACFMPRTLQEALLDDVEEPLAPLDRVPAHAVMWTWSATRAVLERYANRSAADVPPNGGSNYFRPADPRDGQRRFDAVVAMHDRIATHGYQPRSAPHGFLLVDGEDYRFLLTDGQHRAAALRVLGHRTLEVRLWKGPGVIDAAALGPWSRAAGGPYPAAVARRLHRRMLCESGRDKARRLGVHLAAS